MVSTQCLKGTPYLPYIQYNTYNTLTMDGIIGQCAEIVLRGDPAYATFADGSVYYTSKSAKFSVYSSQ